jgi:hypothetical protein
MLTSWALDAMSIHVQSLAVKGNQHRGCLLNLAP